MLNDGEIITIVQRLGEALEQWRRPFFILGRDAGPTASG